MSKKKKVQTEELTEMIDKDLRERSTDFQRVDRMFLRKG